MFAFRLRGTLLLLVGLSSAGAAGCSLEISEQRVLHPAAAGTLSQNALTHAAPVFTVTRHDIISPDGTRLHAVRLRQPGARQTILYFGGRTYTIGMSGATTASRFAPLGVDLFIADYRGYGQSEGMPTASDMAADVLAVFDYLAALPDVDAARIVVHGHSMGSFAAGHVAANRPVGGVVLESSVTTTEDWVRARVPAVLRPFLRVKIADDLKGKGNLAYIRAIDEPVLILVGAADTTTPPQLSMELYAASPLPVERKSLVIVPGAGHSGAMTHESAIVAYRRFLRSVEDNGPGGSLPKGTR
jgi:fermentation-respiration switch protein FrsA (DUF1100 family)